MGGKGGRRPEEEGTRREGKTEGFIAEREGTVKGREEDIAREGENEEVTRKGKTEKRKISKV